jgi:hypothetical protein
MRRVVHCIQCYQCYHVTNLCLYHVLANTGLQNVALWLGKPC